MIKHSNKLIVTFNDSDQKLEIYHFLTDGTQQILTEITLNQLKNSSIEYATSQTGRIILAGLETTRKTLFN